MTITPTGTAPVLPAGSTSLHSGTAAATDAKKELDQEVFLELLVAQLRNQDPTSPMDTTEMMAQSTQLASMEQLTGLADTSRDSFALQMRIAASGLVGQTVSYVDADGVTQTGVASAVSFAGPVPVVTVGEAEIPLDSVSAVTAASTRPPAETDTDTDGAAAGSTSSSDATGTAGDAA